MDRGETKEICTFVVFFLFHRQLQERLSQMMKACQHLLEYSKAILESSSLTTEHKVFAKTDMFQQSMGETANIVLLLKQQMYV